MRIQVLVVDDSISTQARICGSLTAGGISCVQAADGVQALDLMRTHSFDLIITDLWMPRMTGPELVRAMRGIPGSVETPVLAITADADPAAREAFDDLGVTECISKPFSGEELLSAVLGLLVWR